MKKFNWPLTENEPVIDVQIRPSLAFAKALQEAGKKPIEPVTVRGLIDTGFTGGIMLAESIVADWKLKPRNFNRITIPRDQEGNFYETFMWEAELAVKFLKSSDDGRNILIDPIPVTLVEFVHSPNSQALIGQEILQAAIFV